MSDKKTKSYSVPSRKQPVFKIFKKIVHPFFRAKIIKLADEIPERSIIVSNHSAKSGPMALELNYPSFNVKWGAHEMLGNYKSRYKYLRDVFYIQKQQKNKFIATIKAAFEAVFSKYIYKGMKILPTYPDMRIRRTIKDSIKVLESNASVLVFPENSGKGYFDELTAVFPGFVLLAERYFKKFGEDVPVVPVYYGKKHKKIVIGKPLYVQKLMSEGLDRQGVADKFKDEINALYHTYFTTQKCDFA